MEIPPTTQKASADLDQSLRTAAHELEANFLAEMLKSAGLGQAVEAFGDSAEESQFSSFLRLEQAKQISNAGGIGLAEALFKAMKEKVDDR